MEIEIDSTLGVVKSICLIFFILECSGWMSGRKEIFISKGMEELRFIKVSFDSMLHLYLKREDFDKVGVMDGTPP